MKLRNLNNSKAFTLLEVLLAAVVLAVGMSYIIPIFFSSAGATRHLGNRMKVIRLLDERIWDAKKYLLENPQTSEYRDEREFFSSFPVFVTTHLRLEEDFPGLYELDITASWEEQNAPKTLKRSLLMAR